MHRNKLTLGTIHDVLGKRFCMVILGKSRRACEALFQPRRPLTGP